jgi:hypothetical protein
VGNDHIAFEVCLVPFGLPTTHADHRYSFPFRCRFTPRDFVPSLYYSFQTAKIGALVDIQDSEDPEGLRVFYYLVQDLKVRTQFHFVLSFPSSRN